MAEIAQIPDNAGTVIRKRSQWIDIVLAVLLGLAALGTAYSAYKAELLDGDQAQGYAEALDLGDTASQRYLAGNQVYALDQTLFVEFTKAAIANQPDIAAYLRTELMSEELQKGLAWWEAQPDTDDSPSTPFVAENPDYVVTEWVEAEQFATQSEERLVAADEANEKSDKFSLVVVLMAAALFLYGLAAVQRHLMLQFVLIGLGLVVFALGGVQLVTI